MAYYPIEIDAATPPRVEEIIRRMLDMVLQDVHCMLRLPLPKEELYGGCNFAAATFLLSLVAGISTTLYKQAGADGSRFRGVLEEFYPWEQEASGGVAAKQGAKDLWDLFRNPLAHSLGIQDPRKPRPSALGIGKQTLAEDLLEQLERSQTRPSLAPLTLSAATDSKTLHVEGLYWGTREMVRRLTANPTVMSTADAYLTRLFR